MTNLHPNIVPTIAPRFAVHHYDRVRHGAVYHLGATTLVEAQQIAIDFHLNYKGQIAVWVVDTKTDEIVYNLVAIPAEKETA